jgi:CheY-like chemotaxis protein
MMLPVNHRHGDLEKLKHAGVTSCLMKPIKPVALMDVIESVLTKKTAGSAGATVERRIRLNPLRLLVVDDSEDNRFLIQAYFANTPIKIEVAENGRAALEKFKSGRFDMVLMDIQMPIMDGYAALAAIRDWERRSSQPKTPVLALTAFALNEEKEKALAAGFTAHVTKPIRKNQLLTAVLGNAA